MLVDTPALYNEVEQILKTEDGLIVDVETNGLDAFGMNQICGVGVASLKGETYYFPFRHQQGNNLSPDTLRQLMHVLSSC